MGAVFSRFVRLESPRPPRGDGNTEASVVVVTGCDTGFGHMLALQLPARGYLVVATCLTTQGAKALADAAEARDITVHGGNGPALTTSGLQPVLLDVCRDDDVAQLAQRLAVWYPQGIHALVNNAGIGLGGFVEWTSMEQFRRVMDVNYFGTVAMTKALLPAIRRRHGRVVNVASMFGRASLQSVSGYCASKYAVEAFSDALRREVWPFGVDVVLIEPGFAKTPINDIAHTALRKGYDQLPVDEQAVYGEEFVRNSVSAFDEVMQRAQEPQKVVDCMIHAVDATSPRTRYVVGPDARALCFLNLLPTWVGDWFSHLSPIWNVLPAQAIYRRR